MNDLCNRVVLLLLFAFALAGCSSEPDTPAGTPTGKIIVNTARKQIVSFDVAANTQDVIFAHDLTDQSWIWEIDTSAEANQIALAYSKIEPGAVPAYKHSGIYLLPLDQPDAEPQLLIGDELDNEFYFNPLWSADGKSLYYVRQSIDYQADDTYKAHYRLHHLDLATMQVQTLATNVVWPRLAHDGTRLTWLNYDDEQDSFGLFVANADGSDPQQLIKNGALGSLSIPMFSPDDSYIYFTAAAPEESRSLLDIALGVRVAEAHARHDVLSHWWRIPAAGGAPEQITQNSRKIVYGDFAPLSGHLGYTTDNGGLYIAAANGTNEQIVSEQTVYRTFSWLP